MAQDEFNRSWIIETGVPIVKRYGGNLTIRALHYQLVSAGMTNTDRHYKRVVAAMGYARWNNLVSFDAFKDHDRTVLGSTKYESTNVEDKVESAIWAIKYYLKTYNKNRWENQPNYVEVFIEKKALQGVFEAPCEENAVALCPCKGYPSLTYIKDAVYRFEEAIEAGKNPIILYFGDYDPSGEDIPRSIKANMNKLGLDIDVKRIALMEKQVVAWKLPPAPAKKGDSRTANWGGLGQVELDAVKPEKLVKLVQKAIDGVFDSDLHEELIEKETKERKLYISRMKEEVDEEFNSK